MRRGTATRGRHIARMIMLGVSRRALGVVYASVDGAIVGKE